MITANADAKTALQASMNAYLGAPLAFMVTHVLARGQDELTREETIVSRVDDEFEWAWIRLSHGVDQWSSPCTVGCRAGSSR